jgi:hypothetical protein
MGIPLPHTLGFSNSLKRCHLKNLNFGSDEQLSEAYVL